MTGLSLHSTNIQAIISSKVDLNSAIHTVESRNYDELSDEITLITFAI